LHLGELPAPTGGLSLPLTGLRVVAWEHAVAAPLATRHLADLGADVVKIERPSGDFSRAYDSAVNGLSAYFVWLNRGKRSVVLDLKSETDRTAFDRLLDRADVLVHNQGPGAAERLGCDYPTLLQRNPKLVLRHLGLRARWTSATARRKTRCCRVKPASSRSPARLESPAKVGISIADIASGMYAFSSVLAALYRRQATGLGAEIQVSMLEALVEWVMPAAYVQRYAGRTPARTGERSNFIVPYGAYTVGDGGRVNLAVQNDGQWRRLCSVVLQRPDWLTTSTFDQRAASAQPRRARPLIESVLAIATREVEARLTEADVPSAVSTSWRTCWRIPSSRPASAGSTSTVGRAARGVPSPMNIVGLSACPRACPRWANTPPKAGRLGLSRAM
jgi:crotonobetainyl-CoA:carnitine CoA-transferase CaiB-like acyl-CoA transferase